ncbi:MAG: hypothetical protein RL119_1596, partial [Actinomycetota bacterium]
MSVRPKGNLPCVGHRVIELLVHRRRSR